MSVLVVLTSLLSTRAPTHVVLIEPAEGGVKSKNDVLENVKKKKASENNILESGTRHHHTLRTEMRVIRYRLMGWLAQPLRATSRETFAIWPEYSPAYGRSLDYPPLACVPYDTRYRSLIKHELHLSHDNSVVDTSVT